MWEEIAKAIPAVLFSALKFIFGPTIGVASQLHIITTIISTILGMMISVIIFTYFGEWMRTRVLDRFFPNRKRISIQNPKMLELWKKFGLPGIAALTPIIFTPIGGTILAVGLGGPKEKIIIYMLISATVWSIIFSVTLYFFGHAVLPEWVK